MAAVVAESAQTAHRGFRLSDVRAIGLSLLLHAAVIPASLLLRPEALEAPQERSVAVELISADEFAAVTAQDQLSVEPAADAEPAVEAEAAPLIEESPAAEVAPEAEPEMVHPTDLRVAAILAEPASREVRETLPLLHPDERMVQLCSIEAIAQIELWDDHYHPQSVVAYATADLSFAAHEVVADGAAFDNGGEWYRLRFRCVVADDYQAVTDFRFAVGELIPESDWEQYGLFLSWTSTR